MQRVDEIPRIWTESFRIRSFDVGTNIFVSPQSLCRLIQEAAGNHAYQLRVATDLLADQRLMWVLSQIRIVMTNLPRWRDEISIQTWPTTRSTGIRAFRDFRILNAKHEQIGIGASRWLLLSVDNRRPTKLPEFLAQYQSPGLPENLLADASFEAPEHVSHKKEFAVRATEIDLNQHVNNACYVQWAIDTLPLDFLQQHKLSELLVSYVSEAKFGDLVIATTEHLSRKSAYRHELASKSNNQTFALVETNWVPSL